jgi:hypothetical protein
VQCKVIESHNQAQLREKKCAYGVFVVTLEGMRPIGISKRMWENDSKIYLKDVGWVPVHRIDVVEDKSGSGLP